MVLSENKSNWVKYFLSIWALLECILFAGIYHGWSSLVFIYKEEGIYSDLCEPGFSNLSDSAESFHNTNVSTRMNSSMIGIQAADDKEFPTCVAQDSRMSLCYMVGSFVGCLGGLVIGEINYKFGSRASRLTASGLFTTGCLCFGFVSKDMPWLIFPGMMLSAAGGIPIMSTNVQISNLFFVGRSMLVSLLNGALDTSSAITVIIKLAHESGIRHRDSFLVLVGLHLPMMMISSFLFLPKTFIPDLKKEQTEDKSKESTTKDGDLKMTSLVKNNDNSSIENSNDDQAFPGSSEIRPMNITEKASSNTPCSNNVNSVTENKDAMDITGNITHNAPIYTITTKDKSSADVNGKASGEKIKTGGTHANSCANSLKDTYPSHSIFKRQESQISQRSLSYGIVGRANEEHTQEHLSIRQCLTRPMFITHIIWSCFMGLRFMYAMGNMNAFLNRVLDNDVEQVSYFTNVLFFTLMGGIVMAVVTGALLYCQTLYFSTRGSTSIYRRIMPVVFLLTLTCLVSVLSSVFAIIGGSTLLYALFVCILLHRSLLFSLIVAFLNAIYPVDYITLLYSILMVAMNVFGASQYGLFVWSSSYPNAPMQVETVLLCLGVMSLVHPAFVWWSAYREERVRTERKVLWY